MLGRVGITVAIALMSACAAASAFGQDSKQERKQSQDSFDVNSSVGDLHMGKDADANKAGLPLYPGAKSRKEANNDPLNFKIVTESFGFKIVVAKYESPDAADKVIAFYRDKLKKYGKVLECHSTGDADDIDPNFDEKDDSHSAKDKELKCEGENKGPVTELKVGTENNQHVVAVEPTGASTRFSLIYVYSRGKQGDI